MTVIIEQPAKNLREELAALRAIVAGFQTEIFWFSGTGAQTTFVLPLGWSPRAVFVNGALMRPGAGEDFTVAFDGFIRSIVFSVAPAVVDVAIFAQRS
jgi:hypothetical protein